MRWRIVALALGVASGTARADALGAAEVRVAYGLASGGGAGHAALRTSPLVLAVGGNLAVHDQPRVHAYAGLVVETLDRTGAGGEAGAMLVAGQGLRVRAGIVAIAEPYTIWGGSAAAVMCRRAGGPEVCGHLTGNVLVGGTDLPAGNAALQLLVGVAMSFDVR